MCTSVNLTLVSEFKVVYLSKYFKLYEMGIDNKQNQPFTLYMTCTCVCIDKSTSYVRRHCLFLVLFVVLKYFITIQILFF